MRRSSLDNFCFFVSGGDIHESGADPEIARNEKILAKSMAALISCIVLVNFLCTALSLTDIFIDLRAEFGLSFFILIVFIPALLWSLILFSALRFLGQTVYEKGSTWWLLIWRTVRAFPVWIAFPMAGFMAAIPLQVRVVADDVRLESYMSKWDRLGNRLLDIELRQVDPHSKPMHECVKALSRISVLYSPSASFRRIDQCLESLKDELSDAIDVGASREALHAIRRALADDGLIDRSAKAFKAAPGASWFIVLLMMILFSTPVLSRLSARRRPYEYLRDDAHRLLLARKFHIEVHAHDAFFAGGRAIAITRYRGAENVQQKQREAFESAIQSERIRQQQAVIESQRGQILARGAQAQGGSPSD